MSNSKTRKEFLMNSDGLGEDVLEILDEIGILPDGESPRLSSQVDEVVQGLSGAKTAGRVYLVEVSQLEPYPNQPFKLYTQERMRELADDIMRVGVLSPILARRHGKKLQILAGHNRWQAAMLAGLTEVPVLVLESDDDQAILIVTGTNLRQREKLLPSEKAIAYKMQMDALKRQGFHSEGSYRAASIITGQTGDSRMQIHRYVRLAQLNSGLLELLDRGRISMTPSVAISYLTEENQEQLFNLIQKRGAKLTIERANALKNLAMEKGGTPLSGREISEILFKGDSAVRREEGLRLDYKRLREYLPPHINAKEAEDWIIRALKAYRGDAASEQ